MNRDGSIDIADAGRLGLHWDEYFDWDYYISELSSWPYCRWYYGGGPFSIYYHWGSNLQTPGSWWRVAFEQAVADWNSQPIKPSLIYHEQGAVRLNTYWAEDESAGRTSCTCQGGYTSACTSEGNIYHDPGSPDQYRAVAGHELGHSLSVSHISDQIIVLLGYNPDNSRYYVPQNGDRFYVNQKHP
ncbi:MAG: hypothetical protein ACUVX9_16455 [Anaerolineae bacterium]